MLFEGRDLADAGEELRGVQIGYVQRALRSAQGRSALSIAAEGLLAHGVHPSRAERAADEALARVGAEQCALLSVSELGEHETMLVALARTLALKPSLLVIDEPIGGVTLLQRDEILRLLRRLTNEGLTVLAATAEATGLAGVDRAFTLHDGRLAASSTPELARVLPLRRAHG